MDRFALSHGGARRVLLISYIFPPAGGAGVQRATKFVKYLPEHGWLPSVLTVANPSVPLFDDSLTADVPAGTLIRRARTWEPSYAVKAAVATPQHGAGQSRGLARRLIKRAVRRLSTFVLQPDPQVLWRPRAVKEGWRLLQTVKHDAIVVTAPPFSTFLVGARLAQKSGLPLVLDYRDEWDLSSAYWENKRLDRLSLAIQRRMQHRVLRAASAVVATTRSSAQALQRICREAGSEADVTWIYNGFDPDDFADAGQAAQPKGDKYRLAYVGTLWSLTSARGLVDGVRRLARERPELAARLELVFAGRRTLEEDAVLAGLDGLLCSVIRRPYLSHHEAVDLVRHADGLCAILADLPGAGRVVPAKIFEYMAARRPILTLAPRGELWELLEEYPAALTHEPGDTAGIAATLAREIERKGTPPSECFDDWDASRFDRRSQAGELADLLESLTAGVPCAVGV